MSQSYADRLRDIQPFHVMELLEAAQTLEAQGRDIVHLEVGEPDFSTAKVIREAGRSALAAEQTRYTSALGLPVLREEIAAHYQRRYGVDVSPQRVVVTPGASGGLQLLFALLFNPGDQVLLTDPGYPCNRNLGHLYGVEPVSIPVVQSDFKLTPELIRKNWQPGKTKGVLLTTPANPTGVVMSFAELQAVDACVQSLGGYLIVDEIYQGLVYDGDDCTAAALGEHVIIINSFSKYYGMTGWRIGWMLAPSNAIADLNKLSQNMFIAAATPSQYAAIEALKPSTSEELESRRMAFLQRRDFFQPALEALGFTFPAQPQGAFYLFAECSFTGLKSEVLAQRLLHEAGVAATPGQDFCCEDASRYIRFAYTTGMERLELAVGRMEHFLR